MCACPISRTRTPVGPEVSIINNSHQSPGRMPCHDVTIKRLGERRQGELDQSGVEQDSHHDKDYERMSS